MGREKKKNPKRCKIVTLMKTKFNLAAVVWCKLLYAGLLLIFNSCATPDLSNNILRRIKFENKKQENMILKLT